MGGELSVTVKTGSKATCVHSDICHIFKRGVESRVKQMAKVPLSALELALHESVSVHLRDQGCPQVFPGSYLKS